MNDERIIAATDDAITRAGLALGNGERVAFPTETVYGLGADATSDRAVAGIFEAKQRPEFNPLIVHFPDIKQARDYARFSENALELARHFWPGGLTLVLKRKPGCGLSKLVSAGLDSVAVRVPGHDIAQKLLAKAQCPIAAPSANRSGSISPTKALHVARSLAPDNPAGPVIILDGGECRLGIESTVLDMTTNAPVLLRPGAVTAEDIEAFTGPVVMADENSDIKSPGMLSRHYAPKRPMRLNAHQASDDEYLLAFGPDAPGNAALNLSPSGDLVEATANLFSMLHTLDGYNDKPIAVMPIPEHGLGRAINDRLRRAALGASVE